MVNFARGFVRESWRGNDLSRVQQSNGDCEHLDAESFSSKSTLHQSTVLAELSRDELRAHRPSLPGPLHACDDGSGVGALRVRRA